MTTPEHGAAAALRQSKVDVTLLAHRKSGHAPWRVPMVMDDSTFRSHLFMLHGMGCPEGTPRADMAEAHRLSHTDPAESQPRLQAHVHTQEPFK